MSVEPVDQALLHRLLAVPRETERLEWKHNNANPQEIGEYISALANSCALSGERYAYLVWGVDDTTHEPCGTSFHVEQKKTQGQDLEYWLARQMQPTVSFSFHSIEDDALHFVVLRISPATSAPVAFNGVRYIRVASHKKKLAAYPDYERRLWRTFDTSPFESAVLRSNLEVDDIVDLIDYPSYFTLSRMALPENRSQVIEALQAGDYIRYEIASGWSITNLGGILLARRMSDFPSLERKALRVIRYQGLDRTQTLREQVGSRGYASGFSGLIQYVSTQMADSEVITQGLRRSENRIPDLVFRELIANALMHQDFSVQGSGPMVEIFDDRAEITNPGTPLIPSERFVDNLPRSRNDLLARAMRFFGISEERGSGWDKIALEVERSMLPAPLVEVMDDCTRIVVFTSRELSLWSGDDRVRAVYLHACLRHVQRGYVTNASIRERFGLGASASDSVKASKLIKDALEAGMVVPYDPGASKKLMKYVPFWATSDRKVV